MGVGHLGVPLCCGCHPNPPRVVCHPSVTPVVNHPNSLLITPTQCCGWGEVQQQQVGGGQMVGKRSTRSQGACTILRLCALHMAEWGAASRGVCLACTVVYEYLCVYLLVHQGIPVLSIYLCIHPPNAQIQQHNTFHRVVCVVGMGCSLWRVLWRLVTGSQYMCHWFSVHVSLALSTCSVRTLSRSASTP